MIVQNPTARIVTFYLKHISLSIYYTESRSDTSYKHFCSFVPVDIVAVITWFFVLIEIVDVELFCVLAEVVIGNIVCVVAEFVVGNIMCVVAEVVVGMVVWVVEETFTAMGDVAVMG